MNEKFNFSMKFLFFLFSSYIHVLYMLCQVKRNNYFSIWVYVVIYCEDIVTSSVLTFPYPYSVDNVRCLLYVVQVWGIDYFAQALPYSSYLLSILYLWDKIDIDVYRFWFGR